MDQLDFESTYFLSSSTKGTVIATLVPKKQWGCFNFPVWFEIGHQRVLACQGPSGGGYIMASTMGKVFAGIAKEANEEVEKAVLYRTFFDHQRDFESEYDHEAIPDYYLLECGKIELSGKRFEQQHWQDGHDLLIRKEEFKDTEEVLTRLRNYFFGKPFMFVAIDFTEGNSIHYGVYDGEEEKLEKVNSA